MWLAWQECYLSHLVQCIVATQQGMQLLAELQEHPASGWGLGVVDWQGDTAGSGADGELLEAIAQAGQHDGDSYRPEAGCSQVGEWNRAWYTRFSA